MNKKDLQNPIREFLSKDGNSPITEANLTKVQLDKREDYLKQLKKNKKELVKRYGKDAESVMYGRATNLAKKAVSEMDKQKLKELVRKSLMNEDKEFTEEEIQNAMDTFDMTKEEAIAHLQQSYSDYKQFDMKEGKKEDMDKDGDIDSKDYLAKRDIAIQKAKGEMKEDIDLGHEDNEPHMIKGDLYRIGKYAMELYAMVEELEETGQEIDFPAWWQAMITDSKEQMVKSKHYLDFELKEPAIDAAVDALTGEAPHMGEPEAPMMEAEIGKDEMLAGKIMKALKDMANKDASDQHNLKQARIALNKGNMSAAEKIAKPYLSEKIAKQLKEYTYDDFSGSKLIANTPIPTDINIFKKFFPTGVASISNAKASLQASDNSGIKDRMGRYAPMFAHVQYHEFEDQTGEKYRAHQTQYYNSNFDKQDPNFNPSVTDLTLFKLASPDGLSKDTNIGSILVKTDAYIKDLDKLNISKRSM